MTCAEKMRVKSRIRQVIEIDKQIRRVRVQTFTTAQRHRLAIEVYAARRNSGILHDLPEIPPRPQPISRTSLHPANCGT